MDFQGDDPASTLIDSAIATPSFRADLGVWMKSGLGHDTHGFDADSSQSGDLIHLPYLSVAFELSKTVFKEHRRSVYSAAVV
ncbi:uncharacterized protein PG998_014699 [Apiospora kogelbergensis]|uniref:uncharacterized protein n=1 Tax=Apiospora kogelbergensis TaxID=1337665 RepID=UPI00312CE05F